MSCGHENSERRLWNANRMKIGTQLARRTLRRRRCWDAELAALQGSCCFNWF